MSHPASFTRHVFRTAKEHARDCRNRATVELSDIALAFLSRRTRPLYKRLASIVSDAILAGQILPGQAIPPERMLAIELGLSRDTVRKAISHLAADGLVSTSWGSGTIVGIYRSGADRCRSEVAQRTCGYNDWDDVSEGTALSEEILELGLSPHTRVVRTRRLFRQNGQIAGIEQATVPSALLQPAAGTTALYEAMAANRPVRLLQRAKIVTLSASEGHRLEVDPGAPGLAIERKGFSKSGMPVFIGKGVFRADLYDFFNEVESYDLSICAGLPRDFGLV